MTELFSRTMMGSALGFSMAIFAAGCGGSDTGSGGTGGTTQTGGTGGTGGMTTTGGGGTGGMTTTGGGGSGGAPAPEFAVLVRGPLFTSDMAMAKEKHDAIAGGGEAMAKAAGDIAHKVLLGTTELGTTENEFLAMDRWTDAMAMKTFYENPDLQAAFGTLFSGPPSFESFQRQPTWHTWGDIKSGEASTPHYWVVVRGHLAEADAAKAQAAHDAVAGGGEAAATGAGDMAHIVFTGLADPREFLAVDIWESTDNMAALYTNPDFQAAFGALFDAPPTLGVYGSTDWHQW